MKKDENGYMDRGWFKSELHKDFDERIAGTLDEEEVEAIITFTDDSMRGAVQSFIRHNSQRPMKEFFGNMEYWRRTSYGKRVMQEFKGGN